jgi:hypothetical protein
VRTRAGLIIFSRDRIGLRNARGSSPSGPLRHVNFHHGGAEGPPRMTFAAAAATWRAWQRYHMDDHGWQDIGYTLGMDGLGRLYQGRPVGTLTASVGGHNTGGLGLVSMQDGDRFDLTPAARATLKVLCEVGIPELHVPPFARLIRDPRPGVGLFGHREYSGHATNRCPGDKLMRHVKWRREQY